MKSSCYVSRVTSSAYANCVLSLSPWGMPPLRREKGDVGDVCSGRARDGTIRLSIFPSPFDKALSHVRTLFLPFSGFLSGLHLNGMHSDGVQDRASGCIFINMVHFVCGPGEFGRQAKQEQEQSSLLLAPGVAFE